MDPQPGRVCGVLLAAGAGTRLGRGPKALLSYRGVPLVQHLAGVLRAGGCAEVVLVLGAQAQKVRAAADLHGCRVVLNPDWEQGMGSSFRTGAAAVAPGSAALIALVDQPGLSPELVKRLISRHRPGRITAAGYRDQDGTLVRGHPVIFAAELVQAAADSARGDAGARDFLATRRHLTGVVDCGDLDTGRDVDTEADLQLLRQVQDRAQG